MDGSKIGWIVPIFVLIVLIAVIGLGILQSQGWHFGKDEYPIPSFQYLNNVTLTPTSTE